MRDILSRFWCWYFIKWESKNFEEVEHGPKTGASCDISCFDSDCRKHQNLLVFSKVLCYWISEIHNNDDRDCLYYTTTSR